MLDLRLAHRRGGFSLEAALSAAPGRLTVLLGENGAGKTTLLRALAGLGRPDDGRATLDGEVLFDVARGVWPAPESRPVTLLSPALPLFPHLDVRANVAFGIAGLLPAEREARLGHALERFVLKPLADRLPAQLSTGERQRVALARSWARGATVQLLDEPFSALDPASRVPFRRLLREAVRDHSGVTLLVSHDPGDALALADDVIVLEQGRVTQTGPLERVLRAPASAYIARFLGVNLYEGTIEGPSGEGAVAVRIRAPGAPGETTIVLPHPHTQGRLRIVLHPREVLLSAGIPSGSARNHLAGPVSEIAPEPPDGDTLRVTVASSPPITAQVTRASAQSLGLVPGAPVVATFKATAPEVTAYD